MPRSGVVDVPRGSALCYGRGPVHGINFGTTYDFTDVGGVSATKPAQLVLSNVHFDADVVDRSAALRSADVPMIWYLVEVCHPDGGVPIVVRALLDTGATASVFVGADAALGAPALGNVDVTTPVGPVSSSWGFVSVRLLARTVEGPDEVLPSGDVLVPWLPEDLAPSMQESTAHQHSTRASAVFTGKQSVIGMELITDWSLCVDSVHGLVHCAGAVVPGTRTALLDPVEIWYEVEVTNPTNGRSARYTALVDTGATYSVFPAAARRLGATAGGYTVTATHGGDFVGILSVLKVCLLRRAWRDPRAAASAKPFVWVYDSAPVGGVTCAAHAASTASPLLNPEVVVKLDGNFAIIGLNTIAALRMRVHPIDGRVLPWNIGNPSVPVVNDSTGGGVAGFDPEL